MKRKLFLNSEDRVIFGVLSGLADSLQLESTPVRMAYCILIVFSWSFAILYVVLYCILNDKSELSPEERLYVRMPIYKSDVNAPFTGTLGGISEYFGWNSMILRGSFLVFVAFSKFGILTYVILMLLTRDRLTRL